MTLNLIMLLVAVLCLALLWFMEQHVNPVLVRAFWNLEDDFNKSLSPGSATYWQQQVRPYRAYRWLITDPEVRRHWAHTLDRMDSKCSGMLPEILAGDSHPSS